MAYEKLNLQNGDVLDASAIAHMEDGIENAVPPPDGKSYQQLVTDGDGAVGWADRLAYSYEELSAFISGNPLENVSFTGTNQYTNWNTYFSWENHLDGTYAAIFDGQKYSNVPYGSYTVDEGSYDTDIYWVGNPALMPRDDWKSDGENQDNSYPFAVFHTEQTDSSMYETMFCSADSAEHTISLYSSSEEVQTMAAKFLPGGVPVAPVTSEDAGKTMTVSNEGVWIAKANASGGVVVVDLDSEDKGALQATIKDAHENKKLILGYKSSEGTNCYNLAHVPSEYYWGDELENILFQNIYYGWNRTAKATILTVKDWDMNSGSGEITETEKYFTLTETT